MQKISLFHLFILQIQSILESRDQIGQTNFKHIQPKKLQSTFNFCEFVSRCKKFALYKVILKILQSDWVRVFWQISWNTKNNRNFHHRTNSIKYFFKFKKKNIFSTYFWPISRIFGTKLVLPKNLAVMHNFIRASSTMLKFKKKLIIQSQENWTGRRTKGWTDLILLDRAS